jgi:predicted nucleic acid-binding protein
VTITRHGKEVARLLPAKGGFNRDTARAAAQRIRAMRKGVTLDRFKVTAYNAAYLELAQRRRLPLASLEQPLCRVANSPGLTVLGYRAG